MAKRRYFVLNSLSGIIGNVALTTYFSTPFYFMPLPKPNAIAAEILAFGTKYYLIILFDR